MGKIAKQNWRWRLAKHSIGRPGECKRKGASEEKIKNLNPSKPQCQSWRVSRREVNVIEPNSGPPTHVSKANLLTPDCSEGKCSIYYKAPVRSSGHPVLKKPKLPESIFKGQVKEGSLRVGYKHMHNSLIG